MHKGRVKESCCLWKLEREPDIHHSFWQCVGSLVPSLSVHLHPDTSRTGGGHAKIQRENNKELKHSGIHWDVKIVSRCTLRSRVASHSGFTGRFWLR